MLVQEWDWDKAMEINARNAERRVRAEMAECVAGIVADKDAEIADKDSALADTNAEIAMLRAQLERKT